jgi:phosphatidylglycerophosphate synthase
MAIRYSMQDLRQAYKSRNSWWGYFFLHPIAICLLWPIANFTSLRPETICLSSLIVGLLAVPFFLNGDSASLAVGGGIAFVSNLLDAMDGKLARLKKLASPFGAYLDFTVDVVKHLIYIAVLAVGQFRQTDDMNTLYWGLAIVCIFAMVVAHENLLGRIRAFLPLPDADPRSRSSLGFFVDGI